MELLPGVCTGLLLYSINYQHFPQITALPVLLYHVYQSHYTTLLPSADSNNLEGIVSLSELFFLFCSSLLLFLWEQEKHEVEVE